MFGDGGRCPAGSASPLSGSPGRCARLSRCHWAAARWTTHTAGVSYLGRQAVADKIQSQHLVDDYY